MKKKTILSSVIAIVLCLSLMTGSTFALFTSESKVNVAITSATVDVKAEVKGVETFSFDVAQPTGYFENGGTANVDNEGVLKLDKMTPGDKAKITIAVTNNSNVLIQYRVIMSISGELAPALKGKATIGQAEYDVNGGKTAWVKTSAANEAIGDIALEVYFPDADDNNNYQNKSANVVVTVEAVQGNAAIVDTWDGQSADTSWFFENPDATEYTLSTAAEFVGLAKLIDGTAEIPANYSNLTNVPLDFEGVTFMLESDLDLYATDENGEPICFEPIGSYRKDKPFKGTFDGQGHTISNMSQNTWALNNGYYYGDLGMGLFGMVEDATIKNLKMDGASISGENGLCGVVAGTAYGNCTFDNITVTNTKCNDYQYYAGGVVGWASGKQTYSNIYIDETTVLGSQWGDFGNATGGVIGGASTSSDILIKDSTIACRIDAVNDIVSAYQWYCYRNCGMLIGKTTSVTTSGHVADATADQLTCENVTVIYGEWANYTYCEFAGTGYPYVRVQAGVSVDAYSNVRYGHPTDANGNTVVDDNHVHNDGEDHHLLLAFDQLYGGPAEARYCNYGVATHPGVTVIYNNK